jgi:hypothetical protein
LSRRRPPPPPAPGAVRQFSLKAVCSCGRGSDHEEPPELLYHLADMRGHDYPQAFMVLDGRNGSPVSPYREDGVARYRFRCTRCPADKPLREENLIRIYDTLTAASGGNSHPVLNISALP